MSDEQRLVPAVLGVMQTTWAVDRIQDLHVQALGQSPGDGRATAAAYAELSDATCAALGQLAATDAAAATVILRSAVAAARRRGADGVESILLSALLSAVRVGVTREVGDASALWLTTTFPDRLTGGARRVPLLDAERLLIGSVSAPELSHAVLSSGGSAIALAERLRQLVDPSLGEDVIELDDPTLEPVARACADAFAATTTAGRFVDGAGAQRALPDGLQAMVGAQWAGPAAQLRTGKALAVAMGVPGVGDAATPVLTGPVPAGLAPRFRREPGGVEALSAEAVARMARVPANVTAEPPAWVAVAGRTAELAPPRSLRPGPVPSAPTDTARRQGRTALVAVGRPRGVPDRGIVTGTPTGAQPDILTGRLVDPVTGLPVGPPPAEYAEAVLADARERGIDVLTETVVEYVSRLQTGG